MSYKDTLEKLKGLRSSIEKEVPQLLVEQDIYEKTIRQGAEDMNKLLGTLDVDNWHFFTVNPTWGFEVYYINDDVMRSGQYKHRSWSVYFPEDLNDKISYPVVLDKILKAIMVIIRGSDIDYYPFVEEITKVYNTLEKLATQELSEKVLDIARNCKEAYEELKKATEYAKDQLGSKIDDLENLEFRAATEWFEKRDVPYGRSSRIDVWRELNPELDCSGFIDAALFASTVEMSLPKPFNLYAFD